MSEPLQKDPLLMQAFAGFYQELARIKFHAREGRLGVYLDRGAEKDCSPAELATMVRVRLHNILSKQKRIIDRKCTTRERKVYRIASYVMAALADDIFIFELDWPGSRAWPARLLETELFGTSMAGRNIFIHLDRVLSGYIYGPLQTDLCAVFLMALQLGFQGRYRGASGQSMLAHYRHRLLENLSSRSLNPRQPICAQAYAHCLQSSRDPRLAPMNRWYVMGVWAGVAFLFLSSLIWLIGTAQLQTVLGG